MTQTDPRPRLRAALDQTEHQINAVGHADLGLPTPCAEYDLRTLLAHLVAVLRKLTALGNGEGTADVPDPADDHTDDWGETFRGARAELEQVWTSDSALGKSYRLPWATLSGQELLAAYTHEFTVHSWDLARVTGRSADLDPVLAEVALDWFTHNLTAEDRGEGGQFGPVTPVADDADVYLRLAGFVGRPV
ncbi:TIGR03086 family metal-binding protein [Actinophytocola gossypii]|uniref:TIGR03086 family protein n=1 Tax=Actinophytocola gossypii TaxID=2812003 RepID=A0ABT2J3Q6_9PSEU|nr:TIGR03086 family metal-binding protein [Actinophytocola gossypii]MCT2582482.1 TIGR03086 family protein [Actinophytocola gossypii]